MTMTQIYQAPDLSQRDLKYFKYVMFSDTSMALISHDGLLYKFSTEFARELDLRYEKDAGGWFFNDSHDRYIAENDYNSISVNPSAIIDIFGSMPVLFD